MMHKSEIEPKLKNQQFEQEPKNQEVGEFFDSLNLIFENKLEDLEFHDKNYQEVENIQNETQIIFAEIQESFDLLQNNKLDHEQTSDELLNLVAQLTRFHEIVSDTDDKEIIKLYTDIKNKIDVFVDTIDHKYKSTEVFAEQGDKVEPLDIDLIKKSGSGARGAMAKGGYKKVSDWIKNIQEKYIGGFAEKLTNARFRSLAEKIAKNELTPKIAGATAFVVFGMLAVSSFEDAFADVEFSADNDPNNLDMEFDNGTKLHTATLQEFDNQVTDKEVHNEKIDKLFDYEFKFQAQGGFQETINYELADTAKFDYFLVKETKKLLLEKKGSFTKKDFQSLKPSDIYLISSIIMGEHIDYSSLTTQQTDAGKQELERIKKLPLDEAIINGENLACYGMASVLEVISDRLIYQIGLYGSPYAKNLKFEELVVHGKLENIDEAHAVNVMMMKTIDEKTNNPCLLINFIPTTTIAKDENTAIIKQAFIKSQDITLSEDEKYNKISALLGVMDRQENVFNSDEKEQVIEFFKNNYPSSSTENKFVKIMFDKDFMAGESVVSE